MGGRGSGRQYRLGSRDTVERCHSIDVRQYHRGGWLVSGRQFQTKWSNGQGAETGRIGISVGDNHIRLQYRSQARGEEQWHDVDELVNLTWTPCHFGGQRPWFQCPGVVNGIPCKRRVAKLYSGGRYYFCRQCYNLTYESRRESEAFRLISKVQKIRMRLGGTANLSERFPAKPKHMHWNTYNKLHAESGRVGARMWVELDRKLHLGGVPV